LNDQIRKENAENAEKQKSSKSPPKLRRYCLL